jgi:hypothetical protein
MNNLIKLLFSLLFLTSFSLAFGQEEDSEEGSESTAEASVTGAASAPAVSASGSIESNPVVGALRSGISISAIKSLGIKNLRSLYASGGFDNLLSTLEAVASSSGDVDLELLSALSAYDKYIKAAALDVSGLSSYTTNDRPALEAAAQLASTLLADRSITSASDLSPNITVSSFTTGYNVAFVNLLSKYGAIGSNGDSVVAEILTGSLSDDIDLGSNTRTSNYLSYLATYTGSASFGDIDATSSVLDIPVENISITPGANISIGVAGSSAFSAPSHVDGLQFDLESSTSSTSITFNGNNGVGESITQSGYTYDYGYDADDLSTYAVKVEVFSTDPQEYEFTFTSADSGTYTYKLYSSPDKDSVMQSDSGTFSLANGSSGSTKIDVSSLLGKATQNHRDFRKVHVIGAAKDMKIVGDVTFSNTNDAEDHALVLGAADDFMLNGSDITYTGSNLGLGAGGSDSDSMYLVNTNITTGGNLAAATLGTLNISNANFEVGNGGHNSDPDNVYLYANELIQVNGLNFSGSRLDDVYMEAITINLKDVAFPSTADVILKSRDGTVNFPDQFSNYEVGSVNLTNVSHGGTVLTESHFDGVAGHLDSSIRLPNGTAAVKIRKQY